MSTTTRPQLSHPYTEDLDDLALQLLSLGWVLRAPATSPTAPDGILLVYASPFGPLVAVVRLLLHHRIELSALPGPAVLVDDVQDLHHHLRSRATSITESTIP